MRPAVIGIIMRTFSVRGLFALALLSIVALLLLSDFSAPQVVSFGDLGEGQARLTCVILEHGETERGWLLTLQDVTGATMRGFCPSEAMTFPLYDGALVEVRCRTSGDGFLFIDSIERLV